MGNIRVGHDDGKHRHYDNAECYLVATISSRGHGDGKHRHYDNVDGRTSRRYRSGDACHRHAQLASATQEWYIYPMVDKPNQQYLLNDQYKDASNFNARVRLHHLFSTNQTGWHRWVFDQCDMAPGSHILELGCGPGYFWRQNLDRIPPGSQITLSDFSPGMLQEAQNILDGSTQPFSFQVIDAQSIPFEEHSLDIVLANHMLYHVPDRPRAFTEIYRILKPGGHFYATTNGETHLQEIRWLMRRAGLSFFGDTSRESRHQFILENGAEQMAPWFDHIEVQRFPNALVVTQAEPLIAFMLSSLPSSAVDAERLQLLRSIVDDELARHGAIHVTMDAGMFLAQR